MLEGKTDRAGAVEQIGCTVPGFSAERYEAELDEALIRIEEYRMRVRARRLLLIQKAREMSALDGVFALHSFNRKFSRHVGQYGLGPISLEEALGDMHSHEVIEEAVVRTDALIREAIDMDTSSGRHELNMASLRQTHPGFNDHSMIEALCWEVLDYR
ncbi:hypothetical protein [Arthrobacter sp. B0490]|uniref:hypothetical protein n=1 Tax=Arthrobacter sp. B0490 TaxID=2058891 RepID=UPI0011B04EA1|nr:hypothetical protein [Arthrobacter sp. B0490]